MSALPAHPDELSWPARIRAGEHAAFAVMFHAYYPLLCNYLLTYVKQREVAEDLVQGLFTSIWDHREQWHCTGSPRAYLLTSARRRAIDHLRGQRVRLRHQEAATHAEHDPAMAAPPETPDRALELKELAARIEAAVAALPPRAREAFRLTRESGLSHEEAATLMNVSPRTVGAHIDRCLAILRKAIQPFLALLLMALRS